MSKIPSIYPNGGPLYWRNEQSGLLSIAVHRYFEQKPLHSNLIEILRDYLLHWINCPAFRFNPEEIREQLRMQASEITSKEDLDRVIDACLHQALDPF